MEIASFKSNISRQPKIVKRVCVTETLRLIPQGQSITYTCKQLGPYGTACVAVCRLNKSIGRLEYEIETPDNGMTFTVTRNF